MNFLRNHWYDIGGVLAVPIAAGVVVARHSLSCYGILMWCSLIALFIHQLEEYRIAGTFPGMVNTVLYRSATPERYPLNARTALVINAGVGWSSYLLAALFAERAVWLGIATMLVSAGNVVAHTFLFNMKGRTFYNAGMLSAVLLFLPLTIFFFYTIASSQLATFWDYVAGIAGGIILNVVGILKLIEWMANPTSPYVFAPRQMLRSRN